MTLTRDHLRRIIEVAHAQNLGFVELVGLAELDPARAFLGVTVRNVDMRGQDLAGFDFTGATFVGCDLRGADLSRTKGITQEMLAAVIYDETTRLPSFHDMFWIAGQAPSWAENWGHDEYGAWVTFRIPRTKITQCMRWIPSGSFMMGSSEVEDGHVQK